MIRSLNLGGRWKLPAQPQLLQRALLSFQEKLPLREAA